MHLSDDERYLYDQRLTYLDETYLTRELARAVFHNHVTGVSDMYGGAYERMLCRITACCE